MLLPRLIRFRDAPAYLGMDRNRFNSEVSPHADKAIEELRRLKEVNCHLAAHLIAVKQQTEASAESLQSIVGRPRLEP